MSADRVRVPIALTIAGSDSGGGAGAQADLKAFAALGVHGTSVLTCLTAQNPRRVLSVTGTPPRMIQHQLEAVFGELRPDAMKTGMLYSAAILRSVVGFLEGLRPGQRPCLVVDPVMVATSGARLLRPDAVRVLREQLLPLASLELQQAIAEERARRPLEQLAGLNMEQAWENLSQESTPTPTATESPTPTATDTPG